jgi:hypothetical protein
MINEELFKETGGESSIQCSGRRRKLKGTCSGEKDGK